MKKIFMLLSISSLLLTSCASLSSYQDAKPLEKGKGRAFLGGGTYNEQYKKQDDELSEGFANALEDINWILLEAGYRYGFVENFDAGIKFTAPAGISVDGKYMLVGGKEDSPIALSTGGKIGYMSIETGSGDTQTKSVTMDFTLPVYWSQ